MQYKQTMKLSRTLENMKQPKTNMHACNHLNPRRQATCLLPSIMMGSRKGTPQSIGDLPNTPTSIHFFFSVSCHQLLRKKYLMQWMRKQPYRIDISKPYHPCFWRAMRPAVIAAWCHTAAQMPAWQGQRCCHNASSDRRGPVQIFRVMCQGQAPAASILTRTD